MRILPFPVFRFQSSQHASSCNHFPTSIPSSRGVYRRQARLEAVSVPMSMSMPLSIPCKNFRVAWRVARGSIPQVWGGLMGVGRFGR